MDFTTKGIAWSGLRFNNHNFAILFLNCPLLKPTIFYCFIKAFFQITHPFLFLLTSTCLSFISFLWTNSLSATSGVKKHIFFLFNIWFYSFIALHIFCCCKHHFLAKNLRGRDILKHVFPENHRFIPCFQTSMNYFFADYEKKIVGESLCCFLCLLFKQLMQTKNFWHGSRPFCLTGHLIYI